MPGELEVAVRIKFLDPLIATVNYVDVVSSANCYSIRIYELTVTIPVTTPC